MSPGGRVLLLFPSVHDVLAAEAALEAGGVVPDVVPVPKEISSDCGVAITVAPDDRARALGLLDRSRPTRVVDGWQ